MTAAKNTPPFVLVTTAHRGVFAGHLSEGGTADKTVTLTDAHMCVYWPADVRGVLGLAVTGPMRGSRVSPAVPRIVLQDVTAVSECTADAVKAWRAAPWG